MMSAAVIAALALVSCPAPYNHVGVATTRFSTGSDDLSLNASETIAEALGPTIGDPLAEVELTAYFPYGDNESSPAWILGLDRIDQVRTRSVEGGLSPDLIGSALSAAGWTYEDGRYRAVPYRDERLDLVEIRFRVKTDCHPLASLARRLNPYP